MRNRIETAALPKARIPPPGKIPALSLGCRRNGKQILSLGNGQIKRDTKNLISALEFVADNDC